VANRNPEISPSTGFKRAGIGLVIVAALAPFFATRIVGSLTLGRATLILFAGLLAADLLRERPRHLRLERPALLLVSAFVGLSLWILLSAAAWGCNCDGKASGFFEFALIGLLALIAIGFEPRLRRPAIVATLVGILLASALALLGIGSLNSGTVDLTQTGGRLSGTFGNANELGFAAALGIPIALAYRFVARTRMWRIAFAVILLILLATLVLTYSRGAIIAAAVGTLALALWEARGSRRRVLLILGVAGACVVVGAGLYSIFERERRDASFEAVSPTLAPLSQRDLSGWDSRALGPIPDGPSKLFNDGDAIAVRADRAGEGASFRWGEASRARTYTLRFKAKADEGRLPFSYVLGDSGHPGDRVQATTVLGPRWRGFSLVWRPQLRSPHANLYLWQRRGPSRFSVADVRVIGDRVGKAPEVIAVPGQLRGSIYGRITSEAAREERRYVRSRIDAAHLALEAFGSKPLVGIGWGTFPTYAAAHSHYGQLAAHDQYVAFAAELGIVGVLLLGLLLAAMVSGVTRAGPGRVETAAIGVLATAVAGLVFVEALEVPQLSIAIAIAAAVLCAGGGGRERRDQASVA
jgi:O-antigen ligase